MKTRSRIFAGAFICLSLCSIVADDTNTPPATTHPPYPGIDHLHPSDPSTSNSLDGTIDACSIICLSCHDGISAGASEVHADEEWEHPSGFGPFLHPLGIGYDHAASANPGLIPGSFLPSEIILPEGKVGCESCHDLYSALPFFLAFDNQGSALCLGCHVK